ncbi:MAG: type II secretion system protein [Oscillospiraceae bacterium]
MDSNTNCGKSSATKKLKGFTLVELLIVIAIISILAGMVSIVTGGLVRDSRLESARTTAQNVYTAVQNTLVQMEIKQQDDLLNPITYGETGTFSKYVTLEFIMDNGLISGSEDFTISDGTMTKTLNYDYPDADAAADDNEKNFRRLAKYLTDNLSMDFTGYVYAAIDMENWVVDSVVYIEDYNRVKNAANGIEDFAPNWCTKSSMATASNNRIPFCDNVFQQRNIYSGKESAVLNAAGTAVGFYPFLDDVTGTTVSYT